MPRQYHFLARDRANLEEISGAVGCVAVRRGERVCIAIAFAGVAAADTHGDPVGGSDVGANKHWTIAR